MTLVSLSHLSRELRDLCWSLPGSQSGTVVSSPYLFVKRTKFDLSRGALESRDLGPSGPDGLKTTQTHVFTTFLIYIFINRSHDKIAQETLTKYKVISSAYTGE